MTTEGHHERSLLGLLIIIVASGFLSFLALDAAAQTSGRPSAFCHVTDGTFTACPDGNAEWSDVTPQFFAESQSYLYADQADLDPNLATPDSPVDTLMLMYDQCNTTVPLGPDEYIRVGFTTVEVENDVEALEHYVVHIFTDGTIIFIEDGAPQTNDAGQVRVAEIAGQRGAVGFGTSPNCAFDHVFAEFEIKLSATGVALDGGYSPDPQFWGAQEPCDFKCALKEAAATKAAIAAIVGAGALIPACGPQICGAIGLIWGAEAGVAFLIGKFDPPDPNFTIRAEPQFPVFPPVQPGVSGLTEQAAAAVNTLSESHAQSLGLLNAWLATIERVQGAELAGDAFWVSEQSQLAAEFAQQIAEVFANRDSLREAVRAGLIESGFSNFEITADDIRAFQDEIRANGLPFVNLLEAIPVQAFGITNQDLIDVTQELILEVTPEDVAQSLTEIMTDPQLIATTQNKAIHFAEFARSNLPPPPPSATTLTPFRNLTIAGDYVAAGTGLRDRTQGTINISDIPVGATVTEAFLYWGMLDNVESPALSNMNFNGTPITGTLIGSGPDTCWGRVASFAYRADVTSLVPGNGSYDLIGVASGFSTLAQGASLTLVYENPGDPLRQVILMDGNVVFRTTGASATTTIADFTTATPVSAKTTFAVGDGQSFRETASFTGGMGTANFSNPFQGSDGRFWDTDTFDVSAQLAGSDMSAEVNIRIISDCLQWVAQAFSVTTVIDSDRDGVLDELDNCPKTPNPDQADSNLNGIGNFCETGGDNSTAAFLQALTDGGTTVEPTPLPFAEEPPLSEKLVRIVNFRVNTGLTDSAAQTTANLVNSLVNVGLVSPEEADQLVDDVLANVLVPFADFTAEVEIEIEEAEDDEEEDDEFEVEGSFTLGVASDGIDPLSEDVTLKVGTFTTTIPAGSFELTNSGPFGEFEFEGVIAGVELEFRIRIFENNSFDFEVEGEGVDLTGIMNPVEVMLTINNDTGTVSVNAEFD